MTQLPNFIRYEPIASPGDAPQLDAVADFSLENGLSVGIAWYLRPETRHGDLLWTPYLGPLPRSTFGPAGLDHHAESARLCGEVAGDETVLSLLHEGATASGFQRPETAEEWASVLADLPENSGKPWLVPIGGLGTNSSSLPIVGQDLHRPPYLLRRSRFGLVQKPPQSAPPVEELAVELELAADTSVTGRVVPKGKDLDREWTFKTSPVASGYNARMAASYAAASAQITAIMRDAARSKGIDCPKDPGGWSTLSEGIWKRTLSLEEGDDFLHPNA